MSRIGDEPNTRLPGVLRRLRSDEIERTADAREDLESGL